MTVFLTVEDVIRIALRAEPGTAVREPGLLDAAVHRPQATLFGQDAYPTPLHQAAALMHSLIASHPFVDGNKRTGWAAMEYFLALNGIDLIADVDVDQAEGFTLAIAAGKLDDVGQIADQLRAWTSTHPR